VKSAPDSAFDASVAPPDSRHHATAGSGVNNIRHGGAQATRSSS
jgi:hypothetical protein